MFKIITIVFLLFMFIVSISSASDLRNMIQYPNDDGTYKQVLRKGQCDEVGCVLEEKISNGGFIHQWMDYNLDGNCDQIITWKPLDDPTYGRFYVLIQAKSCNDSL